MEELILASSSPRRAALLSGLGLTFRVVPSSFEERHEGARPEDPTRLVESLALGKAREVAERIGHGLVLGADTVVILAGEILEKPLDAAEARRMLVKLSGRWHEVYTGVAVVAAEEGRFRVAHERTRVKFRRLAPEEIEAYVRTGEPMDKAGAYGIQGRGALLVERIHGCYTNVVGLPLVKTALLLREFGLRIL
ncbi:MAG: septum formation inhibitor Maf [Firmicutes bacterium]|nr:septum formation inhibitor Maf [Bacillota bacterium]